MIDAVFGRAGEIGLVIDQRLQNSARVVERKANAERKQTRQEQDLLEPGAGMEDALRADVEDRDRHRGGEENRQVDEDGAQPAALRTADRWMQQNAQASEQQIGKVGHQMPGRLQLDKEGQVAAPDARQKFLARLDGTFGPAMLLRFETVHVHRQLGRRDHVGEENKSPALELRAIAQIEIFAERVVLPAAGLLDASLAPET